MRSVPGGKWPRSHRLGSKLSPVKTAYIHYQIHSISYQLHTTGRHRIWTYIHLP